VELRLTQSHPVLAAFRMVTLIAVLYAMNFVAAYPQAMQDNPAGDPVVSLNGKFGGSLHNDRITAAGQSCQGRTLARWRFVTLRMQRTPIARLIWMFRSRSN